MKGYGFGHVSGAINVWIDNKNLFLKFVVSMLSVVFILPKLSLLSTVSILYQHLQ